MNPFELPVETFEELVAEHGSPLYVVSRAKLEENYRRLDDNLSAAKFYYAVKANPYNEILQILHQCGAGFDVASKGEILDTVAVGADPREDLIFADTVKDPKHIAYAHDIGLDDFTFDNPSELTQLARHAPGANVHVRLMVDNEGSVAHLSTKFGAPADQAVPLLLAARDAGLTPHGVAFHVGSQCLEVQRWFDAFDMTRKVFDDAAAAGLDLEMIDIGGGFPVSYGPHEVIDVAAMCRAVDERFRQQFGDGVHLVAEPGRAVVGDAVALVTKVISEGVRGDRNWLYFDDGTYGSFMEVLLYKMKFPLRTNTTGPATDYVLAGPTCDCIDVFSRDADGEVTTESLPEMHLDDLLIAGGMGAYSFSESTRFNGFEPPAFVFVD